MNTLFDSAKANIFKQNMYVFKLFKTLPHIMLLTHVSRLKNKYKAEALGMSFRCPFQGFKGRISISLFFGICLHYELIFRNLFRIW